MFEWLSMLSQHNLQTVGSPALFLISESNIYRFKSVRVFYRYDRFIHRKVSYFTPPISLFNTFFTTAFSFHSFLLTRILKGSLSISAIRSQSDSSESSRAKKAARWGCGLTLFW